MTGQQLMEALQGMTASELALPVVTEGCDCDGKAGSVVVENDRIYIERGG